ncbi:Exonuclease 3'-5' domain-containing protein 2 [Spatholobus suberectus]|nr:Exonuclease 3'-5' domain-containing protein 2 [Spatholobus suberectus]
MSLLVDAVILKSDAGMGGDLRARIHDEGLKYVPSDQAIVALASQPSGSHSEIYNTIAQADMNMEMGVNSFIPSPSPVVCSHLRDIYHLLANKSVNDDDIYLVNPQKCLGQNGSCPLTIFNYALLVPSSGSCKHIDEETPAIMLLFEPIARPKYIPSLENICVGCTEGNHYLWYQIIPSCYRIHFPGHWKIIHSHDNVSLCVDCHEVARAAVEKYKRKISVEFGIPLYLRTGKQIEERGVTPLELKKAAVALPRDGPRLPLNHREKLTEIIKRYYGGREISEEDLERAFLQVFRSPRERRRLKKGWFSFRHSTGSTATVPEEDNHAGCTSRMSNVDTLKVDAHDGSYMQMRKQMKLIENF